MKNVLLFLFLFFQFKASAQEQFVVYFDTDNFELTKIENQKLNNWIKMHHKDKIVAINGYTDEDGSNSYNDTLAKKRVNHILEIIKEKVSFREDFKSRSFGEDFDQSKTKAKNRKVTIYYIEEKNLIYENEILGIEKSELEIIDLVDDKDDKVVIEDTISENLSLEEKIKNAKIGSIIKIENINFYLNRTTFMNESFQILNELLNVMQNQPNLIIEVLGHVCCNSNSNDKISIKLSHKRAKAIKQFLVDKGIYKNRIKYKGLGSSKPIYIIPEKSEKERIANRRVEIMILEN